MSVRSRGQSEVVGVILLIGVFVVLATVIGAVVLSDVFDDEEKPLIRVESDLTTNSVRIVHAGGDTVDAADVDVVVRDNDSTERIALSAFDVTPGEQFEVGSEWETAVSLSGGGRLFVVHTPSGTVVHESTFAVG